MASDTSEGTKKQKKALKEAKKNALRARKAQKKWEKLKRREARKKARQKRWGPLLQKLKSTFQSPVTAIKALFKILLGVFGRPVQALSEFLEKRKEKKLLQRQLKLKKTEASRIAKAQKVHEKKSKKEAIRKAKLKQKLIAKKHRLEARKYAAKRRKESFKEFLLYPIRLLQAQGEARKKIKLQKKLTKLKATEDIRIAKTQRKHEKLMRKEARRRLAMEKRRKRWAKIARIWNQFKVFWRQIAVIRRIVYFVVFLIVVWIKWDVVSGWLRYDFIMGLIQEKAQAFVAFLSKG